MHGKNKTKQEQHKQTKKEQKPPKMMSKIKKAAKHFYFTTL